MDDWKNIKVDGIGSIERVVAEFNIYSNRTPYGFFRIRIHEHQNGHLMGFTNIKIKSDFDSSPEGGSGNGATIYEAFKDIVRIN